MTKLHRISPSQKPNTSADLIFVHGLGGHHFDTWNGAAAKDAFWPAWLDAAMPSVTVYSAEYDASVSAWLGGAMPITDRASNLLARLEADDIGTRPLVFVTHSLGGLLVKQLLRHAESYGNARWKQIVENTHGVVFLATPHQGSDAANYLQALKHILRTTTAIQELKANAGALRDLNLWYRGSVDSLQIKNQVFFETKQTHGIRVVDEASADPGLAGVLPIPIDADHLEICKPVDRETLVYKSVTKFVSQCLPTPRHEPAGPLSSPRLLSFRDISSLSALISTLDDAFSFRWEQSSFDNSNLQPVVYWPVRLRHPTPIHAAQCFAASGLQQRGAEIHLFVDDLGEQNFPVDAFIRKFRRWFAMNGGNDLKITNFTAVIPPTEGGATNTARPWPTVRKWLGDTEYRMELVLRLAKLVPLSGPLSLDGLGEKRPRRLLTPALVWSCLEFLHTNIPNRPLITLGGYDEKPLWGAWREQEISSSARVGHLYAPQLSEIDNQHGSVALHMANPTKYSLEWESKDDIRRALDSEFDTGADWYKANRLVPWCLNSCVFLPRFFSGQELRLQVAGAHLDPTTSMESFSSINLRPVLVDELARWVI